ncbi:MAG: ISAs1 family transposase, partial [Oligoflexia bacterium]|nr:ISAs1 family transposase [Oligoflexia bacterium]
MFGENYEGKQIAIDGKTVRGSVDESKNQSALHLLNACAVDDGILLAQMKVDGKTNEITVVPEMLDSLDIKGAMISVDALNTQKNATKIIDGKANYTLALKGNHPSLNEAAEQLFQNNQLEIPKLELVEKEHGRHTTRTYDQINVDKYNLPQVIDWKGLIAIGRVQTLCLQSKKQETEVRYYLLSYNDLNLFAKSARNHWGVESSHWILDVTFSEDRSRVRKDHAPQNFSLIRKFAINILKSFKGKLSISLTRIKLAL